MKKCSRCCIEYNVNCPAKDCRYWIDYKSDLNCTLIAVNKRPEMTLQEVAKRLKLSIVRIKQIQDKALKRLQKKSKHLKVI